MEIFELHITGHQRIHEAALKLGIKTIQIELLNAQTEVIGVEHMTSHLMKCKNFEEARWKSYEIYQQLANCCLNRIKIECPYYSHYVDDSKYLEAHWSTKELYYGPMRRNIKSGKIMFTHRIFDKAKYETFVKKHQDVEVELCLLDTNIKQDDKWFEAWGMKNS